MPPGQPSDSPASGTELWYRLLSRARRPRGQQRPARDALTTTEGVRLRIAFQMRGSSQHEMLQPCGVTVGGASAVSAEAAARRWRSASSPPPPLRRSVLQGPARVAHRLRPRPRRPSCAHPRVENPNESITCGVPLRPSPSNQPSSFCAPCAMRVPPTPALMASTPRSVDAVRVRVTARRVRSGTRARRHAHPARAGTPRPTMSGRR